MRTSMKTMAKLVIVLIGVSTLTTTMTDIHAITTNESGIFLECLGVVGVGENEAYSCDRIAMYMAGECESMGQVDWPCDSVAEYIQGHGLQNELRLTQYEVAEDFRVIDRPETDEEKTTVERLLDDLSDAYQND